MVLYFYYLVDIFFLLKKLLQDEEERKLQDKRKAGLFHTFRERLSKGMTFLIDSAD